MATFEPEFDAMLDGVRRGDEGAARQLVANYGHHILAVVRRKLSPRVRQRLDSQDVVQEVWRAFFVGIAENEAIISSEQLVAKLVGIAQNKAVDTYRHEIAAARRTPCDGAQIELHGGRIERIRSRMTTPSQFAVAAERWRNILRDRSPIERAIVRLRMEGETFESIAALLAISERTARRTIERILLEIDV
jgi:RNA polymerase sigma factor (sigma-70 family)